MTTAYGVGACPQCKGSGTGDGIELENGYEIQITLTANQTLTVPLNIQSFPFKWIKAISYATGAFEFNAIHNQPSYQFFNVQANIAGGGTGLVRDVNFWGTAQQPNVLLQPYIFPYNTTVSFTVHDLSGSGNLVRLFLEGVQLLSNDNRTART
jgi:hypothetical protein